MGTEISLCCINRTDRIKQLWTETEWDFEKNKRTDRDLFPPYDNWLIKNCVCAGNGAKYTRELKFSLDDPVLSLVILWLFHYAWKTAGYAWQHAHPVMSRKSVLT